MLQLLLERDQGYADLAALLATDEAEVRLRARAALAEIGGEDPDASVALTDYLLGQADPIDRADVVRHLREHPGDHRLATDIAEGLRQVAPQARLPRLPGESRGGFLRRAPVVGRGPTPRAEEKRPVAGVGLSGRQTRLLAVLASAGVILVVVVLAVTGAFGGDDDDAAGPATAGAGSQADEELERIPLSSPGGGDARGEAIFGLASADQPYVDLRIENLEPPPQDQAYVLWLLLTEGQGHPLTPVVVPPSGRVEERYAIATVLADLAARTRFVDVSLVDREQLARSISQAAQDASPVIDYQGRSVLRGAVIREGASPGS